MTEKNLKCAEAQMMIRKPAAKVFEAFIDPAITKQFWFTKGSGRLEEGKKITWEWEMYNVTTPVIVKEIVPNKRIIFDWDEQPKTVTFTFTALDETSTFVTVTECGYKETSDELLSVIKRSTGGFTIVLDGLKAYLEHHIHLNLVADKFPKKAFDKKTLREMYGDVVRE